MILMTSRILLDTSALTHYFLSGGPYERESLQRLQGEANLVIAPQCLYEFYSVATRPAENRGGLGLTPAKAAETIGEQQRLFQLLADPADLLGVWLDLVSRYGVTGRATHDARLAAFAIAHGIERIATRDRGGFVRFGLGEIAP